MDHIYVTEELIIAVHSVKNIPAVKLIRNSGMIMLPLQFALAICRNIKEFNYTEVEISEVGKMYKVSTIR